MSILFYYPIRSFTSWNFTYQIILQNPHKIMRNAVMLKKIIKVHRLAIKYVKTTVPKPSEHSSCPDCEFSPYICVYFKPLSKFISLMYLAYINMDSPFTPMLTQEPQSYLSIFKTISEINFFYIFCIY